MSNKNKPITAIDISNGIHRCKLCQYNTFVKAHYNKHIGTNKHKNMVSLYETNAGKTYNPDDIKEYVCKFCSRIFKDRSNCYKHENKYCKKKMDNVNANSKNNGTTDNNENGNDGTTTNNNINGNDSSIVLTNLGSDKYMQFITDLREDFSMIEECIRKTKLLKISRAEPIHLSSDKDIKNALSKYRIKIDPELYSKYM